MFRLRPLTLFILLAATIAVAFLVGHYIQVLQSEILTPSNTAPIG